MKSGLLELGWNFQLPAAVHSQQVYIPFFIMEILHRASRWVIRTTLFQLTFTHQVTRCLSCDGPRTLAKHCPSAHQSSLTYRREINATRVTGGKQLLSNYDVIIFKVPRLEIWCDINQSEQHYFSRRGLENCKMVNYWMAHNGRAMFGRKTSYISW